MHVAHAGTSEAAIFGRVLEPDQATLDVAAVRAILNLDFKQTDKDRMHVMLAKAKKGTLTTEEQVEIDNYERVGHAFADEIKSQAFTQRRESLTNPNPVLSGKRFGLDPTWGRGTPP